MSDQVNSSGCSDTNGSNSNAPVGPDARLAEPSKPASSTGAENSSFSSLPDASPSKGGSIKRMVASDIKQNKRLSQGAVAADQINGLAACSKANDKKSRSEAKGGPMRVTRVRFFICTLGLISLSMSQMSRMVLNLSITQMVEETVSTTTDSGPKSDDGSCPWPELEQAVPVVVASIEKTSLDLEQNLDELPDYEEILDPEDRMATRTSTSVPCTTTASQNGSHPATTTLTDKATVERFAWNIRQQSTLLGGFYYSYFVFMVLGGRMAEMYGAKYVLLLAVAGSALINLLTPWMARTNFILLVMSRVVMGAIQSGVFPGMYALISKWLTMSEASIYAPLIKMNLRLGMVLGSLIPGLVDSWPNVFYLTGALNGLWAVVWLLVAKSNPADSSWVSEGELKHILRKKRLPMSSTVQLNGDDPSKTRRSKKTPWLRIITTPSVICLIVVKLTYNYGIDFLAIELPSYLKFVHHASKEKISAITSVMFSIQVFLIIFVGWLAKVMVQRRPFGISKTTVRKLFQSTASLGMAAAMFVMTFNNCNMVFLSVILQIISFLSMFTAGGETMLPYDLSEEYPATIMAVANSIANLSAVTTTTLTGLILGDQSRSYDRWNLLIYIIVVVNLFGGSLFNLLVKAEPIDFEKQDSRANNGQTDDTAGNDNDGFQDVELSSMGEVGVSRARTDDDELTGANPKALP